LNHAINRILSLNLKTIRDTHRELYRELREWFGLPSRVAVDCYRDALANAKAWRNNPHRGRRPRVKGLAMLLHYGSGYRIKESYVEIIGGIKLKIIGGIGGMINVRVRRQGLCMEMGRWFSGSLRGSLGQSSISREMS
jgi:hypothetical protein